MKWFVDEGNTRLKWWLVDHDVTLKQGSAASHHELLLHWHQAGAPDDWVLASVRDTTPLVVLVNAQAHTNVCIRHVHYDPRCLPSHYEQPERLGVDRWLACVGAYHDARAHRSGADSILVVDAGTAVTLDWVAEGAHQGGYILPGLHLQTEILMQHTARVRVEQPVWDRCDLGRNTTTCVTHGILASLVALIQATAQQCQAQHLFITGGNAELICPYVPQSVWRPNLVVEGMMAAARVQAMNK